MNVEDAFKIVKLAFENKRVPHAYLVVGSPRESGLQLAEKTASLLLCTSPEEPRPCGECLSCKNVISRNHSDTLWIEPESRSRIITVGIMRDILLPWAEKGSYTGGWKICIILFADRLHESAANAFLKTLEEPAEETIFLLVTDNPEALLPTIISRCQQLNLNVGRIPPAEPWRTKVAEIMSTHSNTSALHVLSTAGQMVELFAEIKKVSEKITNERVKNMRQHDFDVDEDVYTAWVSSRAKEIRSSVYEAIRDWFRDVMVQCNILEDESDVPLFFPEYKEVTSQLAGKIEPLRAVQNLNMVDSMERQLEHRNMREDFVFSYWFTWLK
ncbi:MAG: hypothetical protein GX804_01400 [Lentisphaerae bacterium]|nr:hypothetical protein [Lentisphaerota bacterium]